MGSYTVIFESMFFFLKFMCFTLIMESGHIANIARADLLNNNVFNHERIVLAQEKKYLNQAGCTMNEMVEFYKKELGIPHAHINFFKRRMENPNINGYAQHQGKEYKIVLAKGLDLSEIRVVTAHELIHIRQFIEGSINKNELKVDYLERSFEDEAFRLSLPLATKFYQQLKCTQTG